MKIQEDQTISWQEKEAMRRFEIIRPLLDKDLDNAKKQQIRKKISQKYDLSLRSIYRYEKAYREGEFEGLKPASKGKPHAKSLPENYEQLLEEAIQLKKEDPKRSVAKLILLLEEKGLVEPGVLKRSTMERHLYSAGYGRKHMKMYQDAQKGSLERGFKDV